MLIRQSGSSLFDALGAWLPRIALIFLRAASYGVLFWLWYNFFSSFVGNCRP